jgi:hypothetical protein
MKIVPEAYLLPDKVNEKSSMKILIPRYFAAQFAFT